jgi:hypothetical protein
VSKDGGADVSPCFNVSTRSNASGGAQLAASAVGGCSDPVGFSVLTVFVHGSNTGYGKFVANWTFFTYPRLRDLVGDSLDRAGVVLFSWPSDIDAIPGFSALWYSWKIDSARTAGRLLGQYLMQIEQHGNPDLRVQFVGHSLGCRTVLSAVKELHGSAVTVTRVLLMGAAVPVSECASDPYPKHYARDGEKVLFSPDDIVLKSAFRAGEWMYSPRLPPAVAVGLRGEPGAQRWAGGRESLELKHEQYLIDKSALRHVAEMFGVPAERPPAERRLEETTVESLGPAERVLPETQAMDY